MSMTEDNQQNKKPENSATAEKQRDDVLIQIKESEHKKLLEELAQYKDKYVRLYAEFENARKRMEREKFEFVKFANEGLIVEFLGILDNLERSIEVAKAKHQDYTAFLQGTGYVVEYPDYQDVRKIGNILVALDEKEKLMGVINRKLAKRIDVFIGQEIPCAAIDSCSIVISCYKAKSGVTGRMAVLGPTRMDYEKVISALDYFSNLMGEIE